jgi:demethylmenaquinone methyltransferase/2-methoxy-6-polyprenyl-1,4-benzoquinol methylase
MGSSEVERGLREQIRYYRRRATEYDETAVGRDGAERFDHWLERLGPTGDVLEIACGTGLWTQYLLRRARSLTALDSAPEMVELARSRPGAEGATFVVADLFRWHPGRRYDSIFFGFWLSHVPPDRFEPFWSLLASWLAPDGRALFVDEGANRAPDADAASAYTERRLRDGTSFRIVKVFHDPDRLAADLAAIGWSARVEPLEDGFIAGVARRRS